MGLVFPHTPGRCRPGVCAFSSSICFGCRYIGEYLTRRCELILPVCGGTSEWDPGATLSARWLYEPRAISNHQVRLGFPHTLRDSIDPGNVRFCPRGVGVLEIWANFCSRDVLYSPGKSRSRRWTQRQHQQRLGSMSPGQSAITQWDWGFHTLRDGIDPGNVCFCL